MTDATIVEQFMLEYQTYEEKSLKQSNFERKLMFDKFYEKYSLNRQKWNDVLIANLLTFLGQNNYQKLNDYLRFISEVFPFEEIEEYVALESTFAKIMKKISQTKVYIEIEEAEFSLFLMSDVMYRYPAIYKSSDMFREIIPALIDGLESANKEEDIELTLIYLKRIIT